MDQNNGMYDFDFWAGEWYTLNKRRTHAMYREQEGEWQTFDKMKALVTHPPGIHYKENGWEI